MLPLEKGPGRKHAEEESQVPGVQTLRPRLLERSVLGPLQPIRIRNKKDLKSQSSKRLGDRVASKVVVNGIKPDRVILH